MSQVTYQNEKYTKKKVYLSTASTIRAGMAVCYNSDYGTATSAADARAYKVEAPATGNDHAFAGIVTEEYDDLEGPAWVEIYVPTRRGQLVKALTKESCVIDDHVLAISTGVFHLGPESDGYNVAKAAQTKSAATSGLTLVRLYGNNPWDIQAESEISAVSAGLVAVEGGQDAVSSSEIANAVCSSLAYSIGEFTLWNGSSAVTVTYVKDIAVTTGA